MWNLHLFSSIKVEDLQSHVPLCECRSSVIFLQISHVSQEFLALGGFASNCVLRMLRLLSALLLNGYTSLTRLPGVMVILIGLQHGRCEVMHIAFKYTYIETFTEAFVTQNALTRNVTYVWFVYCVVDQFNYRTTLQLQRIRSRFAFYSDNNIHLLAVWSSDKRDLFRRRFD